MQAPPPVPPAISRLRNLGVVAHIDAGKTTVSERILFFTGSERRMGEVDEGTTVMDWMPEERERGISITAAATTVQWREHVLNLIDTPGHVDFTVEVERCLRVLDGAILVIDAVAGVQAQSETVWRQMRRHGVPAICFVNKCDRPGADQPAALESLKKRLDARPIALATPLFRKGALCGTVDLLAGVGLEFPPDAQGPPREIELTADEREELALARSELFEQLADFDDGILAAVLEEREVDVERARAALRRGTLSGKLLPVLCGSALKNIGIQPLLDAVVEFLPSPADLPPVNGRDPATGATLTRPATPDAPVCALVFKLHADAHGDLTFVRVYSGTLKAGSQVLNPRTHKLERAARLVRMHADARHPVEAVSAGEIAAIIGLKSTSTGDTLCDPQAPVVLEPPAFPEPVISLVLEPRSTADRDKLRAALKRVAHEDPSFHAREDETTGQWLVAGMGELHLEVMLHRLASEYHVNASMGAPRVAYREAVRAPGRGSGRVDKQLGGKEVFGAVELEIAPAPELAGVSVEFAADCAVPQALRGVLRESLLLSAHVGPRFGFPLLEARITVFGGESRPRVDSEVGFVQAASIALRLALAAATVDLLEPVMSFEIECPPEFASGIIGDLNSRRTDVGGVVASGLLTTITGSVPLVHMFGYSTVVRSLSQGRASFSMQPAGFRTVPEQELAARGLVWE